MKATQRSSVRRRKSVRRDDVSPSICTHEVTKIDKKISIGKRKPHTRKIRIEKSPDHSRTCHASMPLPRLAWTGETSRLAPRFSLFPLLNGVNKVETTQLFKLASLHLE